MAKERKLVVSGLNIVTHPHSPEGYVELLKMAYRMKQSVSIRTTQRLMIGELRPLSKSQGMIGGMFGRIYRFDQIDPDAPWFNVERNDVATVDEMAAIAIPDDLKPNLMMFDFIFYPHGHKFYFTSKHNKSTLSPQALVKLFSYLFTAAKIVHEFGKVELTVIPDRAQLNKILSIPRLTKLTIDVIRPNPDDNTDDEEEVFRRLHAQSARRITQVLTAEPHESIKPDNDTALLAKVAAHNGKVVAIGYTTRGQRIEESTVDKPWRELVKYDPNYQTEYDALAAYTSSLSHGRS
ncbi:MAG: DUF4747 family protein [Gammaproteobacteria bacterium]|nr:DUF4747 family protein [Gammaproteobacteria bacterium]MBU1446877.1 DUF4747 family protein [Gammaproteobacteria bacterium]